MSITRLFLKNSSLRGIPAFLLLVCSSFDVHSVLWIWFRIFFHLLLLLLSISLSHLTFLHWQDSFVQKIFVADTELCDCLNCFARTSNYLATKGLFLLSLCSSVFHLLHIYFLLIYCASLFWLLKTDKSSLPRPISAFIRCIHAIPGWRWLPCRWGRRRHR